MEEFIKTLTEQMRCVKARSGVARELADHITDQAEAYEHAGMKYEDALERAVHERWETLWKSASRWTESTSRRRIGK